MGDVPVSADASTIDGTYTSITPNTDINVLGDTLLTIEGTGFPATMATADDVSITFTYLTETVNCQLMETSSTELKCMTDSFDKTNVGQSFTSEIIINQVTLTNTNDEELVMSSDLNSATAISPASASPVLKTELEISLHSTFDARDIVEDKFSVQLYNSDTVKNLKVVEVDSDAQTIKVMFGGAPGGEYSLKIDHEDLGKIDTEDIGVFNVESVVTSFTPNTGTVFGGTLITITGTNFGTVRTDNPVEIYMGETSVDCLVQETAPTEIQCRIDDSEFA